MRGNKKPEGHPLGEKVVTTDRQVLTRKGFKQLFTFPIVALRGGISASSGGTDYR